MSTISRYYGGHLFNLYKPMSDLEKQIAIKLGSFTDSDFKKYDSFVNRTLDFSTYSTERNCVMYIDAE